MRHSRQAIEQEMRRRICSGLYAPGSRLPRRRELLTEFGASPLTLQRAMDRLAEQGFVRSQGSLGTFVCDRLPNRSTIAVCFPSEPDRGHWNRFWSAIQRTAEGWDGADGVAFRPYYLSDQHIDVPEHRRLCADLADGGLAGMLLVSSPHYLVGSPLLAAAQPRVCIGSGREDAVARYRSSWIEMSDGGVPEAVLRRMRSEGRRRIAFLTHPIAGTCPWLPLLKEIGLATRPEWWIGIPPIAATCTQPVARLLCSGPAAQRPDAVMITDDNLVPFATAGILDAGLRLPQDITVAAHANFPVPTHAAFPCLRFGVDVVEVLRMAIAEIGRQAAGGKPRLCNVPRVIREG